MSEARPSARFVILCLGRTGSTHLQSLLDSHPQVHCYGELFNKIHNHDPHAFRDSDIDDEAEYLQQTLSLPSQPVVGFKLPMNSIRAYPDSVRAINSIKAMRVIRLSRQNMLAQLVSRRLLAQTQISQSIFGSYGDATVEIQPDRALVAFRHIARDEIYLDKIAGDRQIFRISYEALVAGQRLDELQDFLGLEHQPLDSIYERMRTRPMSETVSNWGELCQALAGTEFEALTHEDLG